tara:strand:- start:125 stop:493 length:369 start_codon:yes stop_codon:yes gene_type:complete
LSNCSEKDLTLGVLLFTEDESSASLDDLVGFGLGDSAFKLEDDLLGVLCLLPENGLGLTTETFLLHIISSLSLGDERVLALLILRYLVHSVLLGLPAEGSLRLWNMHHFFLLLTNKIMNLDF